MATPQATARKAQMNAGIKNRMEKMVTAALFTKISVLSPKMNRKILEVADMEPTRITKQTNLAMKTADTEAAFDLILRNVIFWEKNEMATTRRMESANEKSRKASGQKITSSSGDREASGSTFVPKIICFMSSRLTPVSFAASFPDIDVARWLVGRAAVALCRATRYPPA